MVKKLELAEAPEIQVEKKGYRFTIGEIPAEKLMIIQEACTTMSREGFEEAMKILFNKHAKAAKQRITFRDLGQIVQAIIERDVVPLSVLSVESKEEISPSENVCSDSPDSPTL